jgi:hypothetical protein
MRVATPMSGGPGSEESLAQRRTRTLDVRALGSGLEHRFDDHGIHDTHKDRGWPSSHVSVAPPCDFALRAD